MVAAQGACVHVGSSLAWRANAKVNMFFHHARDELVWRAIVHNQVNVGVLQRKLAQSRWQHNLGQRRRYRHTDPPSVQGAQVLQASSERVQITQDARGHKDGFVGCTRGLERPCGAVKLPASQAVF